MFTNKNIFIPFGSRSCSTHFDEYKLLKELDNAKVKTRTINCEILKRLMALNTDKNIESNQLVVKKALTINSILIHTVVKNYAFKCLEKCI